ncbi:MAG: hypothetical protein MJZ85_04895 [Bacteroidales bacterium]|nr:hypothetical protein [Bacteroidales bacterium]
MRKLFFLFIALTLGIGAWATEVGDQFEDATSRLKFEVTSLDPKTVKVIANDYEGLSFTIPATVSYLEDDYAVTAIGENAFDGVGSQSNPADLLLPVDWEGTKPAASATLWYGGYFVDYRAATIAYIKAASDEAENFIEEAATGFVEIEGVKQAKANAASALANAQATADNTINAAADMIAVATAKDDAIDAIRMATYEALVAIEAAIASLKEDAIAEIELAIVGVTDEDILAIAIKAIEDINDATTAQEIDAVKTLALAKINALVLIQVARQGIQNAEINSMINDAVNIISNATDTERITDAMLDAMTVIGLFQSGKEEGKAEALGEMGEPCEDCPSVEVTGQNDNMIKLYNPKKVTFKKE